MGFLPLARAPRAKRNSWFLGLAVRSPVSKPAVPIAAKIQDTQMQEPNATIIKRRRVPMSLTHPYLETKSFQHIWRVDSTQPSSVVSRGAGQGQRGR